MRGVIVAALLLASCAWPHHDLVHDLRGSRALDDSSAPSAQATPPTE